MRYHQLGSTGLLVSYLCPGAMTFGNGFSGIDMLDRAGAQSRGKQALDAGVNSFDTGRVRRR